VHRDTEGGFEGNSGGREHLTSALGEKAELS
jgi:hypothetical protein